MGNSLRRAIGMADLCELLSAAFAFPTPELTKAMLNGSFAADLASCLEDAGFDKPETTAAQLLESLGSGPHELGTALRRGHSILFLTPGGHAPVWPYEAAFRLVAESGERAMTLFRSPCQMDVERHMKEAGVLPKDARTEPSDSVWNEFSFLAFLYGGVARALHEEREAEADEWAGRIVRFWDEHASKWLPEFMKTTVDESSRREYGAEYGVLAEVGSLVLDAVREDVESWRMELRL